jgi:uncharacterized protein DUF6319
MAARGPSPLSVAQVEQVRAELEAGRTPMVWFTPAAVGVDAGRSAKVVSLTEPYEGDFIQVRPTGSHDALSFSTSELTMDKPARGRKPPAAPVKPKPEPTEEAPGELLVVRERPTRAKPPARAKPAEPAPQDVKPKPAAKKARQPAPITVTLSSNTDGEWTVDVQSGSRRTVRPQSVSAGAVAAAARALGGDIEQAIEGAITAARTQHEAKVAQLEAELAAAREALAELTN